MVKAQQKPFITENKSENTLVEYKSTLKKTRQQINKENYQKRKEERKTQQKERYNRKKNQAEQQAKEQTSKYYGAEAIKVLMSFKEYTELNQAKRKLWLDFNWTLQDCQKSFKEGYADVVMIMKLQETAHKLVRDYWKTAQNEEKQRGKSWNSLDYDEKQQLIKYWGYEKARIENGYIEEWERLERQGDSYLKEIERVKFHEERGKIKCKCSWCQYEAKIHKEVKAKIKKEEKEATKFWEEQERKWRGTEKDDEETEWEDGECAGCYEYKKVSTESGLCRKCEREADEGYSED